MIMILKRTRSRSPAGHNRRTTLPYSGATEASTPPMEHHASRRSSIRPHDSSRASSRSEVRCPVGENTVSFSATRFKYENEPDYRITSVLLCFLKVRRSSGDSNPSADETLEEITIALVCRPPTTTTCIVPSALNNLIETSSCEMTFCQC